MVGTRPRIAARVLIIDDEEVLAATLQEFLQGEGYEVPGRTRRGRGSARAASFEPEIALCDVQLPGADGLEVLDRLCICGPRRSSS